MIYHNQDPSYHTIQRERQNSSGWNSVNGKVSVEKSSQRPAAMDDLDSTFQSKVVNSIRADFYDQGGLCCLCQE